AHFNPNHSFAIVYDKLKYEPQYKQFEFVDVYLKDLHTSEKIKVVERLYLKPGNLTLSPNGNYLAFLMNYNWWLYNINTKSTINLTKGLNTSFANLDVSVLQDSHPYGSAGWSMDENSIILYDKYDI